MAHDVFISHSSDDNAVAEAIFTSLQQAGVQCWIDIKSIRSGHDYAEEIMYGIENCTIFLLIYSGKANESDYVSREAERAVAYKKWVLPYRLSDEPMSKRLEFLLSSPQWVYASSDDKNFSKLVSAIRDILAKQNGNAQPKNIAAVPSSPTKKKSYGKIAIISAVCLAVMVVAVAAFANLWDNLNADEAIYAPPIEEKQEEPKEEYKEEIEEEQEEYEEEEKDKEEKKNDKKKEKEKEKEEKKQEKEKEKQEKEKGKKKNQNEQ